jgi:hypothetical protein
MPEMSEDVRGVHTQVHTRPRELPAPSLPPCDVACIHGVNVNREYAECFQVYRSSPERGLLTIFLTNFFFEEALQIVGLWRLDQPSRHQ